MKTKSSIHASARIAGRKIAPALGLIIVAALAAGDATAQVVVINPTGDASNVSGFASQLAKTVEQLQQQVAQYQQLLMTVEGLGTNISLSPNRLQPITDYSSLIDQNCPSSSGGSIVASVVTSIASAVSSSQSIAESQQQLCAQITMVQIDEYNKTVDIANLLGNYGGTLQKLNQLANEVNSLGSTSGATTQAATYTASVTTAINNWQTQVSGDEALIKSLQQQQSTLARIAMRGQNTILGNVVQAGALQAWFAANPYSPKN